MRAGRTVVAALALVAGAGCGGDGAPPRPTAMERVAGDGQVAQAGASLPLALQVRVLASAGKPMAGASVRWSTAGGGSVAAQAERTDGAGLASALWTLGTAAGEQTATAVVDGVPAVTFRGSAQAGPPARLEVLAGDRQTGAVAAALADSLSVKVTDSYGNVSAGTMVTWQVTGGGGQISPTSSSSGPDGVARTSWKLGTKAGAAQGVSALAGSLPAAAYTATALAGPAVTVSVSAPGDGRVVVGASSQYSASALDAYGNAIEGRPFTWSSSAAAVAQVTGSGLAIGIAPGPASISATLDGQSQRVPLTVLAATAPAITSVSPATLVPGVTATIAGSGFSPVVEGNAVTVGGVAVTLTGASGSQLTVTLPPASAFPCGRTQDVAVTVRVPEMSGSAMKPLAVAAEVVLAAGQPFYAGTAAAGCLEIPATGGSYLLSVYNANASAASLTPFRVLGGGAGAGATSLSLDRPVTAAPRALPSRLGGLSVEQTARAQGLHEKVLESGREILMRARAPRALSRSVMAPVAPRVGDRVSVRIPDINSSNLCTGYFTLTTRVAYVGLNSAVLEDTAAALAGRLDDTYKSLADEYDAHMVPILAANFGNTLALDSQLDNNGRLLMVFTDKVNDMGGSGMLGFAWGGNLVPRTDCQASATGEVFYARTPLSSAEVPHWAQWMPSTLIHEAKHVTSQAEHRLRSPGIEEESWLEEASAQVAVELWARTVYGYGARQNVGYAASVGCELTCAGKPIALYNHFDFLYWYYRAAYGRSPFGLVGGDNTYYGSAWLLLRWAMDSYGTDEAAFLRALTQEPSLTGAANLAARTGHSMEDMIARWTLALYADDRGLPVPAELTFPSWNTLDIFAGLTNLDPVSFLYPDPLFTLSTSLSAFTLTGQTLRGGSAVYVTLSGFQAAQTLQLQGLAGGLPPAGVRISILRLR